MTPPAKRKDHLAADQVGLIPPISAERDTEVAKTSDNSVQFHPASTLFPMLGKSDLEDLADDIRQHGLREPIWLHPDGLVLDGRNRLAACEMVGVPPTFRTWDGQGSAVDFVLSTNLRRRHLDESQRALAAAKAKTLFEQEARERQEQGTLASAEAKGRSADKAGQALDVSGASVERAGAVLQRGAPELVEAVEQGHLRVATAVDLLDLPQKEQADVVAKGPEEVRERVRGIRATRRSEAGTGKRTPLTKILKGRCGDATKDELLALAAHCFEVFLERFLTDAMEKPARRMLADIQALRGGMSHA